VEAFPHRALSHCVCRTPEGTPIDGPSVPDFVAFGDPVYPSGLDEGKLDTIMDIRVRSATRRGLLDLEPLPWSRREVEGIAALFPPGRVKVFLGAEATEEEAKKITKGSRILHFATHARVDDRFPLNSALELTMPEGFPENRENGLLQAWEIFEKVRLDADLVVLSGCETALGEEQGGEGLIGLTRAFQYAGARTVMASLWSVQDQATSELMIRFYKHFRAGLPKDEALRHAQIELIRGPIEVVNEKGEKTLLDASAPYYWAGFQIYGDWQ
jgi:CHAT domain-containing protein